MEMQKILELSEKFLAAWTSQEIDRVVACYTEDLRYRDPSTRGFVEGADAMRRYLAKLFGPWTMTWTLREAYSLAGQDGCSVLWKATFQKSTGGRIVEADGMDLVLCEGDLIKRNDVYFDRAALVPLMG